MIKTPLAKGLIAVAIIGAISVPIYYIVSKYTTIKHSENLPDDIQFQHQSQHQMHTSIHKALSRVMSEKDYELFVHVQLTQDQVMTEKINYTPQHDQSETQTAVLKPNPTLDHLPGIIHTPFHQQSLPGFPSYFDQHNLKKDDILTRETLANILDIAYQLPISNDDDSPIEIVDHDQSPFKASILSAASHHIFKLSPTGEFRPNDPITKSQLITAIVRINYPTENYTTQDIISTLPFRDVPLSHWAYTSVKIALNYGIIDQDTLLQPSQKVTLSDALNMIKKNPTAVQCL